MHPWARECRFAATESWRKYGWTHFVMTRGCGACSNVRLLAISLARGVLPLANDRRRAVITRLMQIVVALHGARTGLSMRQLRERLGRSRATLYRDLKTLQEAELPIEHETVNGETRYRLSNWQIAAVAPTPLQLAALYLARQALGVFEGTNAVRELDQLLAKWPRPPKSSVKLVRHGTGADRPTLVNTVHGAINQHRQLSLDYRGARDGTPNERVVEPVILRAREDQLYLYAYDVGRADYRLFKLARIARAEMLPTAASDHSARDLESRFGRSVKVWSGDPVVKVAVRISPEKSRFVPEYPLVLGQEVETQQDGAVLVRAEVCGTAEALRWVLSWGGHAEVIGPAEFRQAAQREVTGAAALYAVRRAVRRQEQVVSLNPRQGRGRVGA
jgi:predicted DNA-binding transcriptional regulator YafY